MTEDGRMNENAGEYAGMDRFECREALLEELREKKLLEATQPYTHSVGHCYRCHTVVEPYLSDQWFVKMRPLADAALAAAAAGKVRFHPGALEEACTSPGSRTSATGASRARSGGATASRPGTARARQITVSRTDPDAMRRVRLEGHPPR